ncbi:hypothetical protein MKX08_005539 [Trichoderma sp. CBMAI-0020]|nr:hypothetical protein MKX08_005539 [Trichoderma sp. CBMAI-0020]
MAETASNIHVGYVSLKDNARAHIGNVVHIHRAEDRCLPDLRNTDPRDDKARIEAIKGGLLEDSYRWILQHGDFQQWRNDKDRRLLWIRGDPGKGKTMLLCGLVNELSKTDVQLSYFFCQASDERINSATAVLRGLIYLIVDQQPSLLSHVQERYKHVGDALFKDVNAWSALSEIFLNILKDMDAGQQQTYIVIDALDECVTDLPKLLDFIAIKSAVFSHVKWIVSSRNWPDIQEHLATTQQMSLCLELNEDSISAAVSAYIKHQVEWLAQKKRYNETTKDTVQQHLSSNSNNTFLWVSLVCQNLEKMSLKNTTQQLNEFPPGLDSLYKRMMQQIYNLEDVSHVEFCCRLLATALHVYRPITISELGLLIKCPDAELVHKAIGFCGSFLAVRDSQVYIIHQSAKDYLSGEAAPTSLPSPAEINSLIFSQSVQAMFATLRRNIYHLHSPSLPTNEIKAPDPDPLEAVRYSCIYWLDHFCDVYTQDGQSQTQNLIDDKECQMILLFFRKYFLYWLEALGLIGHVEDIVLSIIRLGNLLKQSQEPTQDTRRLHSLRTRFKSLLVGHLSDQEAPDCRMQLLQLTQDSQRFILRNSSLIANNPLQVYTSALIFSPLKSLIRRLYQAEEPQWLEITPTVEYNWSPYLRTLRGHSHWVRAVAFSPDGRYIASGSENKVIKIWDATTGKEQQTLQGHKHAIASLAFSPDGRYLASGAEDKTIKLWDATTGKEHRTIQDGLGCLVAAVAFSPDGRYLASGLADRTVKVWDAKTGEKQQTLRGHTRSVTSVAFSPDGHCLASGSEDGTIRVWNAMTGREQAILQGHRLFVTSVAYSPDGRYLASGSEDKTVHLWNMKTARLQRVLQGHGDTVAAVVFSADSIHLASASKDKTVKLWDIATGKTQTYQGHSRAVNSVAFSAGSYLASGSDDTTVKIWDTTGKEQQILHGDALTISLSPNGRYHVTTSRDKTLHANVVNLWDTARNKQHILEGHSHWIVTVGFSPDGRHLASGSHDTTIKIWDMLGKLRKTLRGHSATVRSVAFSADGRFLVSGSQDGTVKIWDVATGTEQQSFKGHFLEVWSVAFSADGCYIASGPYDETITIWDVRGKERLSLRGHSSIITSVAFSLDGRFLASGSHDKTIRIWDTATGKVQQTLEMGTEVRALSFDATASYLYTEIGMIKLDMEHSNKAHPMTAALDPAQGQHQRQSNAENAQKANYTYVGYGLSIDKCWITWNGQNILWLPPDYQPSSESAICGNGPPNLTLPGGASADVKIALLNDSGRVTMVRMPRAEPHPLV